MLRTARTGFLGSLSALVIVGLVPIGAACDGHISSLGDTGDTIQPVTGEAATAAVTATSSSGAIACQAGWAHPNICCSAGPDVAAACGEWEDNKFRACASGSTTYPNLLSCCNLANPSECVDSDSTTSPAPTPPPAYGCGFACPPGWWAEAAGGINPGYGVEGAQCCTTYGAGGTECVPQGNNVAVPVSIACGGTVSVGASGSGSSTGSATVDASIAPTPTTDAGIAPTEDAGTLPGGWIDDAGTGECYGEDAGSGYPAGYDGGMTSLCGECPSGWLPPPGGQPELCCQSFAGGLTLCFSQASGPGTTIGEGDDAGSSSVSTPPTSSGWGTVPASTEDGGSAGGLSCTGSSTSCSCDETLNGHSYALDCFEASSGTVTCSCSIDGATTNASPSVDSCNDSTGVTNAFSASNGCAFPL